MIMPMITLRWRHIIIDVDTQRHFFLNGSIIRVRNSRGVLTNIRRVVKSVQLSDIRTISTLQICNYNDYCHSFYLPAECQKKLDGTLFNRRVRFDASNCTDMSPEILERYRQVIFSKRCFDPFEEPRVDRMLSELQADEFVLLGAPTEGAVKATALGLLRRQKNVTVLVDAVGSCNTTAGQVTLRLLSERGAKLTSTSMFLQCLSSSARQSDRLHPLIGHSYR